MKTDAPSAERAELPARALLTGAGDVDRALTRLGAILPALQPWYAPPAEAGILLCALAAVRPDTIGEEIATGLASVFERADLSRTGQPAVDEAFQLLGLLIGSPAHRALPPLIDHVLRAPNLHPRWFWKAVRLLQALADWRPGVLQVESLIATAEYLPKQPASALFFAIVGPLLLAEPAGCTREMLQRACTLPLEPSEARYVMNALAVDRTTPAVARDWAEEQIAAWFPLRPVWRRLCGGRGLHVLCVQNIADGQGDEIVRVVPLLQALLAGHPETRITLITDRAYLYSHSRLALISFDQPERIAEALNQQFDGLIDFSEHRTPHLNHDTDLADVVAAYREQQAFLLDVRADKGWNHFTFASVRIGGFEWADALQLNQRLDESVYDPVVRLVAELGLPLATGMQPPAEPVLAHDPVPGRAGARITDRPIALINPFGGSDALKGFVPQTFDDLVPLMRALVDEGYDLLLCPNAAPWGSRTLIDDLLAGMPEEIRRSINIGPDPAKSTDRGAAMREIVSLVAQVDLVVTIEGWMMHAAYVNGTPYRLLLMPASGERNWQPWGRAREQHVWYFQGDPALDQPPCPERPRRAAWLELLARINDPGWYDTLLTIARSPDPEIRLAALRALGRLGRSDLQPHFVELLGDPSYKIRALAAAVLLERYPDVRDDRLDRRTIEGHRALGLVPYGGWKMIRHFQSSALPALQATLHDTDPVMRREVAIVLERSSRPPESEANAGGMNGATHEP